MRWLETYLDTAALREYPNSGMNMEVEYVFNIHSNSPDLVWRLRFAWSSQQGFYSNSKQ